MYVFLKGSSTYCLGSDVAERSSGLEIEVFAGDVLVLPAGVSHYSAQHDDELRYLACYPLNGPKWKLVRKENVARAKEFDYDAVVAVRDRVPMPPGDPIQGACGKLTKEWR